jgi:opacity protein-like surface antigen
MKSLILTIVLVLSFTVLSYAEPFLSVRGAYLEPDDDNFKQGALSTYGELGYSLNKYIEVSGIVSRSGYKSAWGSMFSDIGILGIVRPKYPITKKLTIYSTIGIGHSWFMNKNMQTRQATTESVKATNSIALLYGGGIQYFISKDFALFADALYHYSNTGKGSSLDSWGWSYGGGIKWYFR